MTHDNVNTRWKGLCRTELEVKYLGDDTPALINVIEPNRTPAALTNMANRETFQQKVFEQNISYIR